MKRQRRSSGYSLYILYENEETFLTFVSLLHSPGSVGKLFGPLPMHPAVEDNYGYHACAVLCLPCVANILVITTESGMLHHCVVLEGEEEDDHTSEKSWDSGADLIPSLVGLPWIHKLHKFLGSDEEDKDSLQELATEQKCFVQHILCRKPLPCSQPAPFQGFWIIPDILGPTMICITSTYEYLLRPLLSTVHLASPPLLCTREDVEMAESPLLRETRRKNYSDTHQLRHLGNAVKWVTMKKDYQQRKMEKVLSPQKPTITLSTYQWKCIQSILKEKGLVGAVATPKYTRSPGEEPHVYQKTLPVTGQKLPFESKSGMAQGI
ncbi:hypothetical protein E5288_WYG015710 [Bos mutus]|uniref:Uncharacterized protein n=1 Tax=Bos mutus TaxID=72004 RepID=A0A6B0S285_9CETA|nr:hypothetical protein [Bos mutus]